MKNILILLCAMVLCSCMTQSKIDKICSQCPTKNSDSVKIVIEKQRYDSLIFITTPPETLSIASPCDSVGKLKVFDIKEKKHGIVQEIKSDGKQLTFECHDDSLQKIIQGLNTKITKIESDKKETTKIITECHESWWQTLFKWWSWISWVLILVYFVVKRFLKSLPI